MDDALTIFQTIGAGLGVLTAIFLIWDRVFRGRPFVRLGSREMHGIMSERNLIVEVVNPGAMPIIVTTQGAAGNLRATIDDSSRSSIDYASETDVSCLVSPGTLREFTLHLPRDYGQLPLSTVLTVRFRWWPAQSRLPEWCAFPASASVVKSRLDAMREPQRARRPPSRRSRPIRLP